MGSLTITQRRKRSEPALTWCSTAHLLISLKFLHLCLVLKSGNAVGLSRSNQTWPRTPVSALHMRVWRIVSKQCAATKVQYEY